MYKKQPFRFGNTSFSKIIKWTLLATLLLSFCSLISNALFTQVFKLPSLERIFSLTTWGIHKFFLWQFISYLFIQPLTSEGISFSLILHLFFYLYVLWAIGTTIVQARGQKHFIGLYFGGGLFVGVVAYMALLLSGSPLFLAGATSSIYILLIAWVFLFPEARLTLFLLIPMQAKWFVFGLIGINLFLDFSNGNFFHFLVATTALLYAYLYSVLVWDMLSPFPSLHTMDKKLIYLKRKMKSRFVQNSNIGSQRSKIYHFKTGQPILKDDAFMDACLEKISKYGKKSLTLRERFRMWRISKKQF